MDLLKHADDPDALFRAVNAAARSARPDNAPEAALYHETRVVCVEWRLSASDEPFAEDIERDIRAALCGDECLPAKFGLKEIEADFAPSAPASGCASAGSWYDAEEPETILVADVRYYPWPECEWIAVRDGELRLTKKSVSFKPFWGRALDANCGITGGHVMPFGEISCAYRSQFVLTPALSIACAGKVYRYAWPGKRSPNPKRQFEIGVWLDELKNYTQVVVLDL
ncbi:MAG TPA: hypothetical protein PL033_16820 [Candidatus Brocadiia bacterium]|nr:hypothetical protein [Candidatus Brocadiia bacterium]